MAKKKKAAKPRLSWAKAGRVEISLKLGGKAYEDYNEIETKDGDVHNRVNEIYSDSDLGFLMARAGCGSSAVVATSPEHAREIAAFLTEWADAQ